MQESKLCTLVQLSERSLYILFPIMLSLQQNLKFNMMSIEAIFQPPQVYPLLKIQLRSNINIQYHSHLLIFHRLFQDLNHFFFLCLGILLLILPLVHLLTDFFSQLLSLLSFLSLLDYLLLESFLNVKIAICIYS